MSESAQRFPVLSCKSWIPSPRVVNSFLQQYIRTCYQVQAYSIGSLVSVDSLKYMMHIYEN
jgi:hypothetical protein